MCKHRNAHLYTRILTFALFCFPLVSCSYYELDDVNHETVNRYLSNLVERSLRDLGCSYCIEIKEVWRFVLSFTCSWTKNCILLHPRRLNWLFQDDRTIESLTYGRIASYYYLKHQTVRMFKERLRPELPIHELLSILTVRIPLGHSDNNSVITCFQFPAFIWECTETILTEQVEYEYLHYFQVAPIAVHGLLQTVSI